MGRDRAAFVLTIGLGIALVGLIFATYLGVVRVDGPGLSDAAAQLLLTILTALVGVTSGYLARSQEDQATNRVGLALVGTLGACLLTIVGFVMWDAAYAEGPAISTNTANLLAMLLGGTIGAVAAYLGIPLGGGGASTSGAPESHPRPA